MKPSELNIEGRIGFFKKLIKTYIEDKQCADLCYNILLVHAESILLSPASTRYHHAYEGGLADHLFEVFDTAQRTAKVYPHVDIDLIRTGAFSHDLGKGTIYENKPLLKNGNEPKVKYQRTYNGKTFDHIGNALVMLPELRPSEWKDDDRWQHLLHIVASHHGPVRAGNGSLIDPQTPEAHIVHHADMISSRVGGQPYKEPK